MSGWHGAYNFPPKAAPPAKPYGANNAHAQQQQFRVSNGGFPTGAGLTRFVGHVKPSGTPNLVQPGSSLQDDYKKLFGSPEHKPVQLQSSLKGYSTTALPPSAATFAHSASRIVPESARAQRWDKEPAETKDKLKEMRHSLAAAEKKVQELQRSGAEAAERAEASQKRETKLVATLSTANSDFELLKSDYEVLKSEVVYAHRELEVIVDENQKLRELGDQSELALLQAASLMKKQQDSRAQHATALGNERVGHHSELMAKQTELDGLKPQIEAYKWSVASLKQDLRAKENQLKVTMEFNKKSMSVTAKLNEALKQQESQLCELRWSKGMLQNDLKEKSSKIDALQLINATPVQPPAAVAAPADIIAKDAEIHTLKETVQQHVATIAKLKEEQQIRIPWNACKLGSNAKEYLSQLVCVERAGGKRKHPEEDGAEEILHLNKRALRNAMLTDANLSKEVDKAMTEQQAAVGRVQRALLQQQKALRTAQDELEANYARKRCLEAKSKVLREQEGLVARFMKQLNQACLSGEKSVEPLRAKVAALTTELEHTQTALIDTQLSSTELEVEVRMRSERKGKLASQS